MKNLNQALLPKAARRLLHSNGSLWSEILKGKYLKGRSVLDSVEDEGVNSVFGKGSNMAPRASWKVLYGECALEIKSDFGQTLG
ncbi:hypothetical protein ACOSQ2_031849 [Xanthoceras sorbifolium]